MSVTTSVVIPAYNSSNTISRAVDSVLEQTLHDLEVIVVDDGSTDNTAEIVRQYEDHRVECIVHGENVGGSAARNTGIERANGEYIAFLDADDEWHPTKLERQIESLESRSDEWVAAYCDYRRDHSSTLGKLKLRLIRKNERKEGGEELIDDLLSMEMELGGASTLLVRSDVVEAIDGFDERFPRHQDWEFLIRVLKRGKLAYVNEPLVTKHGTGAPSVSDLARAKKLYLEKFDAETRDLEDRGRNITEIHRCDLAMHCFQQGAFGLGRDYLSRVDTFESVSLRLLLFTIGKGFTKQLRNGRARRPSSTYDGGPLPLRDRSDA